MTITNQIAKHFREVYFGKNWTASNLKDHLEDVDWKMATKKIYELNTIATLVHHLHYYVVEVTKVFDNQPLLAKDELSFDHPAIHSEEDWQNMLSRIWQEAEIFIQHIEQIPDEALLKDFTDKKYGNYYRNLHGIIEHAHYHLGQIVVLKKILRQMP